MQSGRFQGRLPFLLFSSEMYPATNAPYKILVRSEYKGSITQNKSEIVDIRHRGNRLEIPLYMAASLNLVDFSAVSERDYLADGVYLDTDSTVTSYTPKKKNNRLFYPFRNVIMQTDGRQFRSAGEGITPC